jgi:hypothetical protein
MVNFYTSASSTSTPAFVPTLTREEISMSRVIAHDRQLNAGARYERFQRHTTIKTTVSSHKFNCDDQTGGGATAVFPHHHYGIELAPLNANGQLGEYVERGTFTPAVGARTHTTDITLGSEPDGWYLLRIVAYDASNNVIATNGCVKYWITIDRNGQARDSPWTVRQAGNFAWVHPVAAGPIYNQWIVYPKEAVTPQARPLPARFSVTPFSTNLTYTSLARVELLGGSDTADQNLYYPLLTEDGVLVAANSQGYEPSGMFLKYPNHADVDGERGIAMSPYPLFLRGGRNGKVYGMTPHSMFVIDSTGKKKTLCGITHSGTPYYWEHPATVPTDPRIRIVGNWDASIPADERWPRESWGFVWDPRSLLLDTTAAPIGGELPHLPYTTGLGETINGPRAFFVDSLNRLVEVQFNGSNRDTPPVCKVKLSGLFDPWSIALTSETTIAISERGANRISEWNFQTWTKVRDIVSSPTASVVGRVGATDARRRFSFWPGQSATTARTYDVVGPEGLDCHYTHPTLGRWLYYGSLAQEQVRRVHLDTGVIEHVCYPTIASPGGGVGSYYVQFAVSDGTFGPAGGLFTTTFYNGPEWGKPEAFKPDGTRWLLQNNAAGYGVNMGAGVPTNGSHYSIGVACHEGRLFTGDSSGQIYYMCKRDGYDNMLNGTVAYSGWTQWVHRGYFLVHGPYSLNKTTNPLPYGEHPDMDYWMDYVVRLLPEEPNKIVGTIVSQDGNTPATSPTTQTFILNLHASGGPNTTQGEQWTATVGEPYADHSMTMTWGALTNVNGINLLPHDRYWRTESTFHETYWMGAAVGTDLRLYTEERLDELMRQVPGKYPGASRTKRVAAGGSMGAWGCMTYALRRPQLFAAVFASRPRWNWTGRSMFNASGSTVALSTLTINGVAAETVLNSVSYVSNAANKIPFVIFCCGRNDGFATFTEQTDAVAALRATNRGFAFAWNDGNHTTGDILASLGYSYSQFELGVGYPILTNCSHDSDPLVDLTGTINAGFSWRNVAETANGFSFEITNTQVTTVDVAPHSDIYTGSTTPKTINIPTPGQWVPVVFP